jgi:hypothetical protein
VRSMTKVPWLAERSVMNSPHAGQVAGRPRPAVGRG